MPTIEKSDEPVTLLKEGLVKLGLSPDDRIISFLIRYIEEIELFNNAYGLVKVKDRRELIIKHILDSLAPVSIIRKPETKRAADAGSGAGLPGIPLAICMPDVEFTLIERMQRRAGFLRNTIAVLGLPNVQIEEADIKNLSLKHGFDLIVFRAFRPLEKEIMKGLLKLLAPDGSLAAYKGRRVSIEEELTRLQGNNNPKNHQRELPCEIFPWEIFPLKVPFLEEERHLLLMRSPLQQKPVSLPDREIPDCQYHGVFQLIH